MAGTSIFTSRERFVTRARSVAVSVLVAMTVVLLMTISRRELWSARLLLYGGVTGFMVYVFCHALDVAVGQRIRRRQFAPDRLVVVPIYFVGGIAGILVATGILKVLKLMPFEMDANDIRISLLISGSLAIVVGLLFYSFGAMRTRLRQSVVRIKEQEFAEKELALAREIQSRLLPPPELSGAGYRISARNLAARFVAGDFYDVFRLSDGSLGVVVADVSGKGMGASLIMASVKAVLPLIAEGNTTAETLRRLNRKLHAELGAREFVALVYLRYEPATGELEISNAGLPDPYRLVAAGRAPELLSVPGPRLPLGARLEVPYESASLTIAAGERVLLLTDGLPEAPTKAGEPLGYEALMSLIPVQSLSTGDLLETLFDSVRRASTPALEDDWTALVLEAVPADA
ncbi:MAG: PP2C family protein-serine/threonine phosphatase [Thermoanaerobaculia bacterium]